ncbi:MAG TPA: NFACT RNA binding domain-containing protein [Chitinispirillaceae bacterium]|nr:NFACT RNA binding domain-containing protein [Chitinispirillaceae bacterium]
MSTVENESIQERLLYLSRRVKQLIQKTNLKLSRQNEELEESQKALWYQQIGDSLLTCTTSSSRGTAKITLLNIHTQEQETVAINPKLNLKENAQLFFKKAKKGKRGLEVGTKKVETTRQELLKFQSIDTALSEHLREKSDPSIEQIDEWETLTGQTAGSENGHKRAEENGKVNTPYRYFSLDGWNIFIGKSDTQNDELSTRFAHPSDIWLHVAGHAGSHVIIQRPKGQETPPAEVLKIAASLSVWFSKAKHTSYAEVHYTEARFVHKRRHSPAGEVIAERCKSIRVSPRSPQDIFPSTMYTDSD